MHTTQEEMRLSNINGGAAEEVFSMELEKVVQDMLDPNKERDKPRSITLTITLKPSKEDRMGVFTISGKSSLAPVQTMGGYFAYGKEGGRPVIREVIQESLFPRPEETNIVHFNQQKGGDE